MKNILLVFFLALVSFGFSQKNGPYIDPILQNDVNKWIADAEAYDAKWYKEFSKVSKGNLNKLYYSQEPFSKKEIQK